MKVLVADRFSETAQARIAESGMEVINAPDLRDAALTQAVAESEATILIVRSTLVEATTLNAGAESLRRIDLDIQGSDRRLAAQMRAMHQKPAELHRRE